MQKEPIIVTPNRRFSRYLQNQFCSINNKNNITTWRSKKILPLTTWLMNCWHECPDYRILLNSHQERLLWKQIVKEVLGSNYINITDTVIIAHKLKTNWLLDDKNWEAYETEEISIFKQLSKKFTEYCKNQNLVVSCQLPSLLLPYLQQCSLEITFANFDEYNPQLQKFITTLQKANWKILHYNSNNYKAYRHKKISFAEQYDEITTVARWAKQIINYNQKVNIGIITNNLPKLRPKIIRILTEVLGDIEINISAGIIFNSIPIVNGAFDLLYLNIPLSLSTFNKILLSPYIKGAESEKSSRALLDFQLNQLNQPQFSLSTIAFLAERHSLNISSLINALQNTKTILQQTSYKKMLNSDWAQTFAQILQTLGWPGENNLTNLEAAAVKRFTELLHEFATTSVITDKTTYKQAVEILQDMAIHTVFQTESKTDAPINALGTLEAVGINFDYLWVMGLDQENWPPAPTPNPFIPIQIQKKFGLPHSSAEQELNFCETLIKWFKNSAPEVVFSYVKQADNHLIEPSALIADIPEISIDALNLAEFTPREKQIYSSKKMENLIDTAFIALAPNELVQGGSRLLEAQSLCPFRAFAEFRLAAKEFKKIEPGIDKFKRGILIHNALEYFWQEVKTHSDLCSLTQEALQNLITKNVECALNKENLSPSLYMLEYKCLTRLLHRWLEIEKNRPPFEVVAAEKNIQTTLGSLQIKLRIDRIDKLTNGSLLLIDYKTGKRLPTIFDWFGKRPQNPQLPLYCVAVDETQSFAFAQINIESIKFKNPRLDELAYGWKIIDEDTFKNNIDWHDLIAYWHENLTGLARDFVSGHVQPNPLSPQVCIQCEFGMICRYA